MTTSLNLAPCLAPNNHAPTITVIHTNAEQLRTIQSNPLSSTPLQHWSKLLSQQPSTPVLLAATTTPTWLKQQASPNVTRQEKPQDWLEHWLHAGQLLLTPELSAGIPLAERSREPSSSASKLPLWLIKASSHLQQPLINTDSTPSPPLELWRRVMRIDTLHRSNSLIISDNGAEKVRTSASGSIIPLLTPDIHAAPTVHHINFEQPTRSIPASRLVIIGDTDSEPLSQWLPTFASLLSNAYLVQPDWVWILQLMLLALITLYSLVIIPRLPPLTAGLFSALLLLCLTITQLTTQLVHQWCLPMGSIILCLLANHLIMAIWLKTQQPLRREQHENHQLRLTLASLYKQNDRLEEALDTLKKNGANKASLNRVYEIAAQQERKRQYQEACTSYEYIRSHQPKFKDIEQRIEKLSTLQANHQTQVSSFAATSTLVLPQSSLQKPVLGRYQIERELGRGAMGTVYLGIDPKISRQVAIKTLNFNQFESSQLAEVKARFFREAEAAGKLDHPNIVTVYDVGEEPDLAFIAMDYVEGEALDSYNRTDNLLPTATVYELMTKVAAALAYAHEHNIVHRDIKPSNIMYNARTGELKVADFGIARITDDSRTKTGDVLGSPIYMPPEQLKGQKVTGAADIYALGVTFYQLLSGEAPFKGDSLANLTYEILHSKQKPVRELSPTLPTSATRLTNKALQKNPDKRFVDAFEMAEALQRALKRDFSKELAL